MSLDAHKGIHCLTAMRVQQHAFTAPALPQGRSFLRAQIGIELLQVATAQHLLLVLRRSKDIGELGINLP